MKRIYKVIGRSLLIALDIVVMIKNRKASPQNLVGQVARG
jgi:hypothetical protein